MWKKLVTKLCFCCKNRPYFAKISKQLQLMHEMRQRLNFELDIVELIKSARYSRVLSKIKLKKIQRTLISSFKNYNMNEEKPFRV